MKRKFKKLIKNPEIFFRDLLIKRYPVINCEQKFTESEEAAVSIVDQKLQEIEAKIVLPNDFPVDIVYTWVNDQDPIWQQKKSKFENMNLACENSNDSARFENHNELYYSVLSVKKNLPWVRKIFIVTDNQRPEWLVQDEKIEIIDHSEIIDHHFLPTFNSHVIEANLYKIKGLSEHFIYFNDDVFVAKPLKKEHFFRKNGMASIFVSDKSLQEMENRGVSTATLKASQNSRALIAQNTGFDTNIPLVHTYVPLRKNAFEQAYSTYEDQISEFLNNKFRGKDDLNIATFLVPWLMYIDGKSVVSTEICYYFNIRSNHRDQQYEKLLAKKKKSYLPHSFCLNDVSCQAEKNGELTQKKLQFFLKKFFEI
ncbi:Stealth CR1 domain-containing protein [Acinetobacter faecalis]|uniref:Stealth CR1 domain-containing protein n=1 Tax=Acinetobacter faecalis TaxID=2665161 RepID=UPI002A913AFA|nr:Stealth CR1 domain-containing protein [Acinetobacter faecalis]MDY6490228.1 Stealth CR1 domain-containing protein [Acinetobacter faecalis]